MALLSFAEGWGKECGICYEPYQDVSNGRVPKLLWCSHTVCLVCLRKLVCLSKTLSFVVCPFCRMVTTVSQEGLQALRNNEALLREVGPAGVVAPGTASKRKRDKKPPRVSNWVLGNPALTLECNRGPDLPAVTVSGIVPAPVTSFSSGLWGGFRRQEMPNSVVIEIPPRAASAPASVENLRTCVAVTLILLMVFLFLKVVIFQ